MTKEKRTQPNEKIEDKPRIFLIFFWFQVLTLLIKTLNPPKNMRNLSLLKVNKSKGINFCQIDNNQISFHLSFWINFKYQKWKGTPPNFKIKERKKKILNKKDEIIILEKNLISIITLLKDWIKK